MRRVLLFDLSRTLLFPKDTKYIGSINEFYRSLQSKTEFVFFNYFELKEPLYSYLKKLSETTELYLFTTETIQEDSALKEKLMPLFKRIFSAKKLALQKHEPEAYVKIAEELRRSPAEILFIDDTLGNITAAKSAGLQTIHYTKAEQVIAEIKRVLSS